MKKQVRQFLTILNLLLLLSCCTNAPFPRFAEILALGNSPTTFSLKAVEFFHDPNLPYLTNDKVMVVAGARLNQDFIAENARLSVSFDELAEKLKASMGHELLRLDIDISDNIAKARSFESLLALTAFSHLERVFAFAKKYSGVKNFKRPLLVAVYGEIISGDNNPQSVSTHDNALYVGSADTVFLLPLGKEEGLPLTMHEGVLAHELHHRIFFNQVFDNPRFANLWSLFQSRYDPASTRLDKRSRVLLNALDEGLADVFAVAFTGLPNYLNLSLTHASSSGLRKQRDLSGHFAEIMTYDLLATAKLSPHFIELCGADSYNFTNPKFNVYCLGTVIAKALFDASLQQASRMRNELLLLLPSALNKVASSLNEGKQFDLDIFFAELVLLASASKTLQQRLCREIEVRFLSLATEEKLPACREFLGK